MVDKIVVDADLGIKLGGSNKYRYLYDVLPMVAKEIYMHTQAHGEVMMPSSAVNQLKDVISAGTIVKLHMSQSVHWLEFHKDELVLVYDLVHWQFSERHTESVMIHGSVRRPIIQSGKS